MAEKIKELTAEQQEKLEEFREEYLRKGLTTEPAPKEIVERAVANIRRDAGFEHDVPSLWFDGPASGAVFVHIVQRLHDMDSDSEAHRKCTDILADIFVREFGGEKEEVVSLGAKQIAFNLFGGGKHTPAPAK